MRKSLLTATAGLAVLALTSPGPTAAQGEADQQLGNVAFRDVLQRRGAAPLRSRHALSAFVLVQRRQGDLRGGRQGRRGMRHGPLGRRAVAAQQSACRHSRGQPAARSCRDPEGQAGRRQDRARARLHRRAGADVCRLRQTDPYPAHPRVPRGDGEAGGEISEGRRGADRLRHHAQHLGVAGRQDLCPAEQRRGNSRADLEAAAAAPGRHALPDPSL